MPLFFSLVLVKNVEMLGALSDISIYICRTGVKPFAPLRTLVVGAITIKPS
jgi:hypothetical protein